MVNCNDMTEKKVKGQMTFGSSASVLREDDVDDLRGLLKAAVGILDKRKVPGIKLERKRNDAEDLIEKLKNKRDIPDPKMTDNGPSFENINPSTIVSDFNECKLELQKVKIENEQLKSELELSFKKLDNSSMLITQLKKVIEDLAETNKSLKNELKNKGDTKTLVEVKQESQQDETQRRYDDEINIGSVLSEITQLEDDYQDPMFQTQQSNTHSSPMKNSSPPNNNIKKINDLNSSPSRRDVKLEVDGVSTIGDSNGVLKRRNSNFKPSSPTKRRLLLNIKESNMMDLNVEPGVTTPLKIDLSKNPKTKGPWYPEDFQLVNGYDKIDDNYGQSLDQIPKNTRWYYENQLEYIREISMRKFNQITLGSQHKEKFQFIPTKLPCTELITPEQTSKNLLNPHILNEFKFEINEFNLIDYQRYYNDITRTKKVKRWNIDETPPEWYRSEFLNTQDQIKRNEKRDKQSQRKALLRLFHSCFLIENKVQCGMWKFKDSKLNALVSSGEFQIDLNLFISGY